MKKIYSLFTFLFLISSLYAQDKMIVNQDVSETRDYENSISLKSVDELPASIKKRTDRFLGATFGSLLANLKYSNGEIVDLKTYFENDSSSRDWIIPKYKLNFLLQDSTIGIKKYLFQLRLDEYGQILFANWPREGFSDKTQLLSRAEIEQIALNAAKERSFEIKGYSVDFAYREKLDALCWIFEFPLETDVDYEKYDVLEIDWKTGEITFEGQSVNAIID